MKHAKVTSPFLLPDGPVQVAFSGGRTSGYMLHHILEANGGLPARVEVTFQNTGREMPQTLDFVQECSDRWGVRVTWLEYRSSGAKFEVVSHNSASRDGEPFEDLICNGVRQFLPNRRMRYCTEELKTRVVKRYLMSLGWTHWTSAVGIRADEPARLGKQPRDRWKNWWPLADAGVSKHDVEAWWQRQPFDLRLPVVNGNSALGNCDGCFLKSEATLAMLARDYPERHAWWERMEAIAARRAETPQGAQFREGQAYASLRDFVERQGDWIFDDDAYLCQKEDGECMG